VLQDAVLKETLGDYTGARASAEEVLKQSPEDTTAVLIVADSYLAQKQPALAQARLAEMVAARPNSAPLQFLMGQLYSRLGNTAAARQNLERAKAANARYFQADLALAELDRRAKQPERARQRLVGVLATDPKNVALLMALATIEEEAGNAAEAMAAYRKVLDADGSNLTAMNNLAYHLALEDPDAALKLAQEAAEAAPESPDVQDTLGWVFYRKGIYETATRYLKSAYTKSPTAQRQFHLAMAYLKQGQRSLGQEMLVTALQKSPDLTKTERGW
jgi:tetratricopeptide (TPR) repeat protein